MTKTHQTIVVGAGVFGAWTAWWLRKRGEKVLLVDALGPANARASSGGESRMTRGSYGPDDLYTRFAHDSLAEWQALSQRADLPLFHRLGALFFFRRRESYVEQTLDVHRRLKLPTQELSVGELARRWPQVDWDGISVGLYEPEFGALMARRAVQTLVREFTAAGGDYLQAAVLPPTALGEHLELAQGERIAGARYVFACGPWLPKLFPALLGSRVFPTRQEVFFFAPPVADAQFQPAFLPCWADFNDGDIYYGFPDLESRGFKIAHDQHGAPFDPDTGDRLASAAALADVRGYLARRFPALAAQPLNESRVCQYENSSNGDFFIDRHPDAANVLLVGGGSGHGFKHGPEVGRYAARLLTGELENHEARFSLASKGESQNRAVH